MARMDTEKRLRLEIKKWTRKMKKELENIETVGREGEEFLVNIKAYVSDSGHFLLRGNPVKSFEAIVWAWAWLEIGLEIGSLKKKYNLHRKSAQGKTRSKKRSK